MTMPMSPSGAQHEIASGGVRAVVVEVGGGLRELTAGGVPLVDGYSADELCVAAAGQVLMPWPNRIGDGRYRFGGEDHQLPLDEPSRSNAIHGLVRWAPWTRLGGGPDHVELGYELFPTPGYPWHLRLRTRWSVGPRGLRAEHDVENVGGGAAPFGFAVHPYLVVPGVPVDDLVLHLPARTRVRVDERLLPLGDEPAGDLDFTEPKRIGDRKMDTAFGDLVRRADGTVAASIRGPSGQGVELRADPGTKWWQIYTSDTLPTPRFRRSIAVEPMTCPPDAFRTGRDLIVLQPGDRWSGWWEINPIEPT